MVLIIIVFIAAVAVCICLNYQQGQPQKTEEMVEQVEEPELGIAADHPEYKRDIQFSPTIPADGGVDDRSQG